MNWLCQNYNKQKRGGVIIRLARAAQMMVGAVAPAVISEFYRRAIRRLGVLRASGTRTVAFGLLFAVAPFVFAVPTYAADDSTVSVTVDQNAALQPAGNLYKATANVTVKTSKSFGFNLTMQADTSDLIHATDPTHKISAMPSVSPADLNANQWGYALAPQATQFRKVPAVSDPAAVIADVTKAKPAGCANPDDCTKQVTFAANVDPAKLASGKYYSTITYTATAKTPPHAQVVDPTVCRSGDPKNDCQVDLDANMIPVKYTGDVNHAEWTSLANREDAAHQGEWYNYNQKQWANAVTVKPEALSKYRGQNKVVDQADILGYWVYIPRYAYEVMRRDGTDKPVPAQNFLIRFEKTTTPKRVPAACPEQGKDYRTECYLDRDYINGKPSAQGTWATHPAFTFGTKELNGIWFAKFETTGSVQQPTVLPNEKHISSYTKGVKDRVTIRAFYEIAKSLGVKDQANTAGMKLDGVTLNNNNLSRYSSHLVNNTDWGAATYLSASDYGAGYNGVQTNGDIVKIRQNADENGYFGNITGCGPEANGSKKRYDGNRGKKVDGKTTYPPVALGTQSACNINGTQYAYNGALGQLASTTNNPTGIYDMSGGGNERVAAAYNKNTQQMTDNDYIKIFDKTGGQYFGNSTVTNTKPPYTNLYNFMGFMHCTWVSCGGQALHETHIDGKVEVSNDARQYTADNGKQWLKQSGGLVSVWYFDVDNNSARYEGTSPWFSRGGDFNYRSNAGLFSANSDNGRIGSGVVGIDAFRVALAPVLQD